MREIKFRAWNKYPNGDKKAKGVMNYDVQTYASFGAYCTRNTNNILMQFTGLKDKNDKEIYEGDIIPNETHGNLVCEYAPKHGSFVFWKDKGAGLGYPMHHDLHKTLWEVIGNIHENPDLL